MTVLGTSNLCRFAFDLSKEYYARDLGAFYDAIFGVYYPDPELCRRAEDFSCQVGTSFHEERNKVSEEKTRGDHYLSKIAEWGVYKALKGILPDLSYPSFEIHERKDKRWSSDLFDAETEISISVKCCSLSTQEHYWEDGEPSFVFGYRLSKGDYDKKFFGKRAWLDRSWVCLCVVDESFPATRIFFINRISSLFDTWPYREPRLRKHRNSKRVIYGSDLLSMFRFRSSRSISSQIADLKQIALV